MDLQRRTLLKWSGAASALGAVTTVTESAHGATATPQSQPISALGLDAAQFGVRSGAADDQSANLQRAIDRAAQARAPLALAPGVYRASGLRLPAGAALVGVRGATRLVTTSGATLITAIGAEDISISGLTLDGLLRPLPQNQGLLHMEKVSSVRISGCAILASGRHGIRLAWAKGKSPTAASPMPPMWRCCPPTPAD